MANQPPLADNGASEAQTEAPSFWDRIWSSPYKPHVLNVLYFCSGGAFIFTSAVSHSQSDQRYHVGRLWGLRVLHFRIFHTEFYDMSQAFNLSGHPWILHGGEVWELYAIGLTMVFSLLLLFESAEVPGIARIFFLGFIIVLACITAGFCLGWHFTSIYQIVLLFIVIVLATVDGLMFRVSKTPEYKLAQFFVDIPVFISLLLLTFYVGVPMGESHKQFFSGALAFQFIIGCLLVLLVRAHERILRESSRRAPVLLILIVLNSFQQIILINQKRRADKKALRAAAGSGGRSSGGGQGN